MQVHLAAALLHARALYDDEISIGKAVEAGVGMARSVDMVKECMSGEIGLGIIRDPKFREAYEATVKKIKPHGH